MNAKKAIGLILIIAGIAALVYGGFTYTKQTHDVELGPVEFQVAEKERVNVPAWGGVIVVAAGVGLLLMGGGRRRSSS